MGLIKSIKKKIRKRSDRKKRKALIKEAISNLFPDLIVKNGPFKGMQYPSSESVCSSIFPKLLGSYEKELEEVINEICQKRYDHIVDIGCAEGYYAVGLARNIVNAHIFAFDTDKKARKLCRQMSEMNDCSTRFSIRDVCTSETLKSLPLEGKALIISDCEGFEKHIFTQEIAELVKNHDLLIETHDCIDIEISTKLKKVFEKTHCIKSIYSLDDIQKAISYTFRELEGFTLAEKRILLGEVRGSIMEWLYITSKE